MRGYTPMPNKVYSMSDEQFLFAINSSDSISGALAMLQLRPIPTYYKALRQRCQELGVAVPIRKPGLRTQAKNIEDMLVENSTTTNGYIKLRLLRDKTLPEICAIEDCPTRKVKNWCGAPLMLQLDHINGVHTDNRLENLRFLCPNCHSQTETWCGRKKTGGRMRAKV